MSPGPVAQWIERRTSNPRAEVRFLPGPFRGVQPYRKRMVALVSGAMRARNARRVPTPVPPRRIGLESRRWTAKIFSTGHRLPSPSLRSFSPWPQSPSRTYGDRNSRSAQIPSRHTAASRATGFRTSDFLAERETQAFGETGASGSRRVPARRHEGAADKAWQSVSRLAERLRPGQ
jgi:hypothetical protein